MWLGCSDYEVSRRFACAPSKFGVRASGFGFDVEGFGMRDWVWDEGYGIRYRGMMFSFFNGAGLRVHRRGLCFEI